MPKACVIAGAGATYADAVSLPVTRRPPLDRGFFSIANYGGRAQDAVGYIRPACSYMEEKYGIRLVRGNPSDDSFELALSTFYIDMVSPALQKEARDMFMMLIHGFNRWLAASTNTLNPGRAGRFYRILASLLNGGYASRDITIITLNQDIQIEKALASLGRAKCRTAEPVFCFPGCYRMDFRKSEVTHPREHDAPKFVKDFGHAGVKLLKLHGSLNWYSVHNGTPSSESLLDTARPIFVTSRASLTTSLRRHGKQTLPIMVPPIALKSIAIHKRIIPVWKLAEESLSDADEIIVFGYSCPSSDLESSNMLRAR